MRTFIWTLATVFLAMAVFTAAAQEKQQKNVAIFLYNGVEVLDFAGPAEVFAATRINGWAPFHVYTVAATTEPIISQGFIDVVPDYSVQNCPKPDIMVLPGGGTSNAFQNAAVMNWVEETAQELDVAMSVCTGAFILAKAGMLDGKKATTWHGAIERFRSFAPNTEVLKNTRFVDNGTVVTTAGVSAGIDGALHLVSRFWGEDVARATARYMEYDKWVPDAGSIVEHEMVTALRNGKQFDFGDNDRLLFEGELRNLGHAFREQGNTESAVKVFELTLQKFPDAFLAHRDLATTLEQMGESDRAQEHYLAYLKMNQSDLEIVDKAGFAATLEVFSELARKSLLNERQANLLGYRLLAADRIDQAIRVFRLNVEAFPESWNVYDSLAEAYMKQGKDADALKFYKKSLALNPDNNNAKQHIEKLTGTH